MSFLAVSVLYTADVPPKPLARAVPITYTNRLNWQMMHVFIAQSFAVFLTVFKISHKYIEKSVFFKLGNYLGALR
jgi:hypothetical protein